MYPQREETQYACVKVCRGSVLVYSTFVYLERDVWVCIETPYLCVRVRLETQYWRASGCAERSTPCLRGYAETPCVFAYLYVCGCGDSLLVYKCVDKKVSHMWAGASHE